MKRLLLQRFKRLARKILAYLIWRIGGPLSPEGLSCHLHHILAKPGGLNFWERLTTYAYRHELTAYTFQEDAYLTRDAVDIFSYPELSETFLGDFRSTIDSIDYTKAGIINTVALSIYGLIRHCQPSLFIESGTASGYSASIIATALLHNDSQGELVCLSLFDDEQRAAATQRLSEYSHVKIIEGESQIEFNNLDPASSARSYAMFIDGPKARSKAWDILTKQVAESSDNLQFVCFDSCQEHAPYLGSHMGPDRLDEVRSLNWERAKVLALYENEFRDRGFKLAFQSNQFCEKYDFLNEGIYQKWNNEIGDYFKWAPYEVDRIHGHYSYSFKLGVIYHPGRCNLDTPDQGGSLA